jgi:hypothetical protein
MKTLKEGFILLGFWLLAVGITFTVVVLMLTE